MSAGCIFLFDHALLFEIEVGVGRVGVGASVSRHGHSTNVFSPACTFHGGSFCFFEVRGMVLTAQTQGTRKDE